MYQPTTFVWDSDDNDSAEDSGLMLVTLSGVVLRSYLYIHRYMCDIHCIENCPRVVEYWCGLWIGEAFVGCEYSHECWSHFIMIV